MTVSGLLSELIQQNFNGSNTDGLFTTAVSNLFLSPWKKSHSCRFWDNLCHIETHKLTQYTFMLKKIKKDNPVLLPDRRLWFTLISSNYPCLKHIFMVLEVFEPLKCYCIYIPESCICLHNCHDYVYIISSISRAGIFKIQMSDLIWLCNAEVMHFHLTS